MNFVLNLNQNLVSRLVKKHLLIAILCGLILGGALCFYGLKTKENIYSSSGEMVQNDNNYTLISSYQQFAESTNFKDMISTSVKESKWKDTAAAKHYSISLSSSSTSPFFTLSIASSNKKFSKYFTNVAMQLLISNLGKYLSGTNVSIVTNASPAQVASYKKEIIKLGIIGFVVGFLISMIVFIFRDMLIGKVKDRNYLQDFFNVKELGTIMVQNKNYEKK